MWRLLGLVALVSAQTGGGSESPLLDKVTNNRQKKLLFFDEQGNLVKTYANRYLYDFGNSIEERHPLLFNYLNPFYSVLRPNIFGSTIIYTIPVSNAVLTQLYKDPSYHNQLIVVPTQKPDVERSPLCANRRTQIPSPKTCSNFLNCWDGWAWEQECPAGLLFSNNGYCDYPYNVDCNNRYIKEETKSPCNKDFEAFKNNDNCQEFFVCVHRLPVKFQCPTELAYNEELGICDYPEKVHCNTTHELEATTPQPVEVTTSNEPSTNGPTTPSDKKVIINKTEYNSQSWKSLQIAISRQDAIRQLQLDQLAHIHTSY
ncbi:unnamed protein product [Leptosia nina]|uniref:Chitin-binding type-2 domain-containing protein n=1 Tax=Leptosia nina TaxID=320188 RepID=A0AAV1JIZ9_9NEOP